ncbi:MULTISPECIES: VOC family protein [unclassified Pseudomonas]|uniref:VOC family protein n=1 Tax=unclassified Pseudomonas TaxID=196821 RepID=UPI002AC96C94|nr:MULTISPECIES: VOC family protein [unclassified Pseudomonas]MEB0041455.1 VOC family protein [Pseudomonas sp. MH10]MEB0121936.1 VOC family protein [Pseudomonas sp. CCI1.2]WPX64457.1 VOC family protein [Pseudomonas sp. MH10]
MHVIQKLSPCLWFAEEAEEAVEFYTGIFKDSRILGLTRYSKVGFEMHHRPAGSVMSIMFELEGQRFTALNGGPLFTFTEAVSLQIYCKTQAEIDHYWNALTVGADVSAQQCGWLKDKFGLSWQVVPELLAEMINQTDPQVTDRVMSAMMEMKKLDLNALQQAVDGV